MGWTVRVICASCQQVIAEARQGEGDPPMINVVEAITNHKKDTGCVGEVYVERVQDDD